MNYMGIDHHKQYSHITLLDEKGEMVKLGRVVKLRRELEKFLQGIGNVKAVIEAGRSSYTMVDVLDDMGIKTAVAHPKDVKAIAKAKVKTDERDSYKLAHLLRTGYIPEVYKRSRENRSSQRVLRQRAFYVGKQTSVKNRLRALLAQQGEEIRLEVARVEDLFTAKGMKMFTG
ncbi:MAG: transposase [Acidobacteriota bacterium]|nr:transposase [Acidobacteriota bacterium]